MHGDLGQIAREKALKAFRTGEIDVLVATDVAARGIDIDDITHVINYQIPEDEQAYVHRIGRTGRAGKTGVAVTLVDWDELERWAMIDKAPETGLPGSRPRPTPTRRTFYTELGIPAERHRTIGAPRKPQQAKGRAAGSAPRTPSANVRAATDHVSAPAPASPRADTSSGRPKRRPTARPPSPPRRVTAAPPASAGAAAVRATRPRPPRPPADRRYRRLDGQTRTPHQGRSRRRGDDRACRRGRRRPVLVEQLGAGHHQPAGDRRRSQPRSGAGRARRRCTSCGRPPVRAH